MMRAVFALLLIAALTPAAGCVIEYREVMFYPNGTQQVGRDWFVVNFTNTREYDVYNVVISYRGGEAFIPLVRSGEHVEFDPYALLDPTKFPVAINATLQASGGGYNLTYSIYNEYDDDINVKVSIPVFNGFRECVGCNVIDDEITFSAAVPAESSKSFSLIIEGDSFSIPDGRVYFSLKSEAQLSVGVGLNISIEKKSIGSNLWGVKFRISNPLDDDVNVTLVGWMENSTSKLTLFERSLQLPAKGNVSYSATVFSVETPVFYLKAEGKINETCECLIEPVTKVENRYVAGYGLLKGIKYSPPPPAPPAFPAPAPPVLPPPAPPVPPAPPAPAPVQPQPQPVPVEVVINLPEISLPAIAIEAPEMYVAMIVPAAYGFFFAFVLSPAISRRGIVVGRDVLSSRTYALLKAYGRKLYASPSEAFPGCVVVQPDEELVQRLLDIGLNRVDAEKIAVAVKVKKPLITTNREVARIAVNNGCLAILVGERYGRGL